jgi:hypothetical protein
MSVRFSSVNFCWSSPAESFFVSGPRGTHDHILVLSRLSSISKCGLLCLSHLSFLGKCSVKCIPHFSVRQRLGKHVSVATNTRNNRRIFGNACLCVCLCIFLSLLGNNSVKTFRGNEELLEALFAMRSVLYLVYNNLLDIQGPGAVWYCSAI